MRCEKVRELLSDYIDGELEESSQVEEHLHSCGECRRELESLRKVGELLREMGEPERSPAKVAVERLKQEREPGFRAGVSVLSTAAVVLLALVLYRAKKVEEVSAKPPLAVTEAKVEEGFREAPATPALKRREKAGTALAERSEPPPVGIEEKAGNALLARPGAKFAEEKGVAYKKAPVVPEKSVARRSLAPLPETALKGMRKGAQIEERIREGERKEIEQFAPATRRKSRAKAPVQRKRVADQREERFSEKDRFATALRRQLSNAQNELVIEYADKKVAEELLREIQKADKQAQVERYEDVYLVLTQVDLNWIIEKYSASIRGRKLRIRALVPQRAAQPQSLQNLLRLEPERRAGKRRE